jgi:integrase/recombinase XerD
MSTVLAVPSVPSITIFVRHSADCKFSGDESHKTCRCPKHFRYSLDGKQIRQSAHTRFWRTAEERRRQLEDSFAAKASAVTIEPDAKKTIERSISLFITSKRDDLSAGVRLKYARELARFESFMSRRSKFFPHEIESADLIEFRAGWTQAYPSSLTRQKVQERLRAFLRFLYDARLIDRVPKLPPVRVDVAPTLPLTAAQFKNLLAAIPKEFPDTRKQTRIRALVKLMRHSGLSIHDAVTLEREELKKSGAVWRVTTNRQKTGTNVSLPIPSDVAADVVDAAKLNSNPAFVFWSGNGQPQTAIKNWHHVLRKLFNAAGMPDGHPHMLRDTFACRLLEKGVPLEEVSKLLGHTSIRTTERHYAPWVQPRQKRLDDLVISTWGSGD